MFHDTETVLTCSKVWILTNQVNINRRVQLILITLNIDYSKGCETSVNQSTQVLFRIMVTQITIFQLLMKQLPHSKTFHSITFSVTYLILHNTITIILHYTVQLSVIILSVDNDLL